MLDFFNAEWLRFRAWAIAYFVLHLAVLGFLTRVVDLAQQPRFVYQVFAAMYVLSGLLLGAFQMGTYRRPNAWLHLLHRPVAPARLASALMLAAALLLLVGVLLPLWLTAAWQHGMSARPVDARHLWLALSAWLLALCGYLAGAFALVANRRIALAACIVPVGLCFASASGMAALAVQLLALAWLAAMLLVVFRPDALAPPHRAAPLLLVGLPLHLAMWFALLLLAFGAELVWIMQGTHPNNLAVEIPGSAKQADNAQGRALMIAGLQASRAPQAARWAEQAAVSEVHTTGPNLPELPARGELMNPAPLEFDDAERRVRWVFSHEDMRFHGYRLSDQRSVGTLGIDGQQPFAQPPLPAGDGLLVTRTALYQFDAEIQRIKLRARVPGDETILGLDAAGERLALLSQRALYLFDLRDLHESVRILAPRARVALPGKAGNLTRIDWMELLDGELVSFCFTRGRHNGQGLPYQRLLRIDEGGRATPVAARALSSGYGPVYIYNSWYTSPVLFALQKRATALFAGPRPQEEVAAPSVPAKAWTIALALALASMALAAWRGRQTVLSKRARALWIVAAGLLGPPSLLSLWLLYPRRERFADASGTL